MPITARLPARKCITARLGQRERMTASVQGFVGGVSLPEYDGAYEATPRTYEETVLATGGKTMRQDVTVHRIPQFAVSNPSGGTTLIIGEEFFDNG